MLRTCRFLLIISGVVLAVTACAFAQMPLDLIGWFESDHQNSLLWDNAMSPGDLDGDGYSELFVREHNGERYVLVFKGGDPPDQEPDMIIGPAGPTQAWIPDINGDGVQDFATMEPFQDSVEKVDVYFGGPDFLTKTSPDLIFPNSTDSFTYFGSSISAGDINGDGQNDLIIAATYGDVGPYDGRFYIYFGGSLLDTMVDDCLSILDKGNGYNDCRRALVPGDINGDGLVDFVCSGLRGNGSYPSYVAVIYGSNPLHTTPDVVFWTPWGENNNFYLFGEYLYSLGDIDKNGCADFAVTGQALWPCVYFGGPFFDTIPLILGDTTDTDTRGAIVATVGDINHDGWDDIGVGNPSLNLSAGIVYLYYGYRDMNGDVDLILPESEAWPYVGREFGHSVGPAGDFNGDGYDDLVVTASDSYNPDIAEGLVYVYAGDPNLPTPAEEISDNEIVPSTYAALYQNYPNPFNQHTTIRFSLRAQKKRLVELAVYNIMGQRARTLLSREMNGGEHVIYWDGMDDRDKSVPTGIYFCVLKSGDHSLSKKMLYLK